MPTKKSLSLEKTTENQEYIHEVKQKIGRLILMIAKAESIKLSNKYRFRIDFAAMRNDAQFYRYFQDKKRMDGTFYISGKDIIPSTMTEWMADNFSELSFCITIYEKSLKGQVVQQDLKALNRIYRKYK